jgi:hypothetical protein
MLKSNNDGLSSWIEETDGSIRPREPEEFNNWWYIERDLRKRLDEVGLQDLDIDQEELVFFVLDQCKQIQEAEDKSTLYDQLLTRIDDCVQEINKLNSDNARKACAVDDMLKKMRKYGTHTDTCAIFDGLDSGRIIDQKECDCGWDEYRKELEE